MGADGQVMASDLREGHSGGRLADPRWLDNHEHMTADAMAARRETEDFTATAAERENRLAMERRIAEHQRRLEGGIRARDRQIESHFQRVNGLIDNGERGGPSGARSGERGGAQRLRIEDARGSAL